VVVSPGAQSLPAASQLKSPEIRILSHSTLVPRYPPDRATRDNLSRNPRRASYSHSAFGHRELILVRRTSHGDIAKCEQGVGIWPWPSQMGLHGTTKIAVTAMFAERSDEGRRRSSVYSLAQPEGPQGLPVSPARQ
jgi:hypothetical protein